MRRVRELDGLRAVAILLVLGCHYEGFARLAHGVLEFGWVGVDIFFVLSGYLITTILIGSKNLPKPYRTFYSRRAFRILPPYFAVLLGIVAFGLFSGTHYFLTPSYLIKQVLFLQTFSVPSIRLFVNVCTHLPWHLSHIANLRLDAGHLPMGSFGITPNLVFASFTFWSVSIEEYFYVFWAPIMLRCSRTWIVIIACSICIAEILLRWIAADASVYFSLLFRFDALIYGAFLALLITEWKKAGIPAWAKKLFWTILATSAITILCILILIHPVLDREIRSSPLFLAFGLPVFSLGAAALMGILVLEAGSDRWFARLLRWRYSSLAR